MPLGYRGVRKGLIAFATDTSPYKQGKFLRGSHIPGLYPAALRQERPDVVSIKGAYTCEGLDVSLSRRAADHAETQFMGLSLRTLRLCEIQNIKLLKLNRYKEGQNHPNFFARFLAPEKSS